MKFFRIIGLFTVLIGTFILPALATPTEEEINAFVDNMAGRMERGRIQSGWSWTSDPMCPSRDWVQGEFKYVIPKEEQGLLIQQISELVTLWDSLNFYPMTLAHISSSPEERERIVSGIKSLHVFCPTDQIQPFCLFSGSLGGKQHINLEEVEHIVECFSKFLPKPTDSQDKFHPSRIWQALQGMERAEREDILGKATTLRPYSNTTLSAYIQDLCETLDILKGHTPENRTFLAFESDLKGFNLTRYELQELSRMSPVEQISMVTQMRFIMDMFFGPQISQSFYFPDSVFHTLKGIEIDQREDLVQKAFLLLFDCKESPWNTADPFDSYVYGLGEFLETLKRHTPENRDFLASDKGLRGLDWTGHTLEIFTESPLEDQIDIITQVRVLNHIFKPRYLYEIMDFLCKATTKEDRDLTVHCLVDILPRPPESSAEPIHFLDSIAQTLAEIGPDHREDVLRKAVILRPYSQEFPEEFHWYAEGLKRFLNILKKHTVEDRAFLVSDRGLKGLDLQDDQWNTLMQKPLQDQVSIVKEMRTLQNMFPGVANRNQIFTTLCRCVDVPTRAHVSFCVKNVLPYPFPGTPGDQERVFPADLFNALKDVKEVYREEVLKKALHHSRNEQELVDAIQYFLGLSVEQRLLYLGVGR